MVRCVNDDNRMLCAGFVKIFLGRVTLFRHQRIVESLTRNRFAFFRLGGQCGEDGDIILNACHGADGRTVQIRLEQVEFTLSGKVPMTVDKAGQHCFTLEIHNLVHVAGVEETLGFGFRLTAYENNLSIQRSDNFNRVGGVQLRRFTEIFRYSVDSTVMVNGIGLFISRAQLHTSAKNQCYSCCKTESIFRGSVFHSRSSCNKPLLGILERGAPTRSGGPFSADVIVRCDGAARG